MNDAPASVSGPHQASNLKSILIGATGLTVAALVGGKVIVNGIVLGTLMTTGGVLVYNKLPEKAKKKIRAHPLITDASVSGLAVFILGTTVTGLVAGATTGLMISALLGNRIRSCKQDND